MNNKDFDQFIKKSMEHLKDDTPSDWSAMEHKLNMKSDSELSSEMEDIYLDGVAYDHLRDLQEPYEPANWDKMSARLDEEYAYRRKVVITKSLEILVVLLLIWTGINFFPNKKIIKTPTQPVAEKKVAPTTPQHLSSEILSSSNTATSNNTITTSKTITSTSSNSILADNLTSSNNASTAPTEVNINATSITNENPFFYPVENFSLENENSTVENVPSIESRSMTLDNGNSDDLKSLEAYNDALLSQSAEAKQGGILKTTLLAIISPLKSLKPSFLKSTESKEVDLEKMLALRKAKSKGLMVSMFGSSDFNHISTLRYNEDLRTNENIRRNDFGYGGGITLAFHAKKLLVETGLVYHFIRYQQVPNTVQFGNFNNGYFEQQWEEAEINLIQIPLHFQYRIYQRKRWNLYGLAGASLNVAVQNNFAFQETDLLATNRRSQNGSKNNFANQAPNYNGVFEGGDLATNSYLSANFGFGIERYFSYRWSMFIQPVYRYNFFLDGIGPESDLLHSGSIQLGTKVRLRK